MTETALNERIVELQENESEAAHQWQKVRRRLRRDTNIRKTDNLLRIINYGGYAPHRGYIDWGFRREDAAPYRQIHQISQEQQLPEVDQERNKPPDSQVQGCSRKRQLLPSALRLLVDTVLMR